jgi:hypothetical protein
MSSRFAAAYGSRLFGRDDGYAPTNTTIRFVV